MNKYEKWYNNIIQNAKNRILEEYSERHHIIPRSLGGNDDESNLINLTAKEHFVCHWLLVKMHIGEARGKMINALYIMQGKNTNQKRYRSKITSRVYSKLRNEYRQYISNLNKGRIQPLEEKAKQIAAMTGRKRKPFNEKWRAKLSAASKGENNSRYGAILSEETRKKIGNKIRGRNQTEEEKERRRQANLGKKQNRILCPHCRQSISVNTYPRWHGDRCKQKGNTYD
jgi:hypothetical protein